MSLAREPGPVRATAGRARTVARFAALALVVITMLVAIARLADPVFVNRVGHASHGRSPESMTTQRIEIIGGGLAGLSAFEQDAGCVNIIDADVIDGDIIRRMIRAVNLTPYNLAKHEHYLTVAERIVAVHRDGLRSREQ